MADSPRTGDATPPHRRIVAVGLKTYLGYQQTLDWLDALAASARVFADRLDMVVFPVSPALPAAVALGRRAGFTVGAQDVSEQPAGAFTGETPAGLLAELGVRYVEIGHAERRFLFGETSDLVVRKVEATVAAGLIPLICVGEGRIGNRTSVEVEQGLAQTIDQLEEVLPALHDLGPFVVAYEPVWAIGADQPAPTAHVRAVAAGLRERLLPFPAARVIYGGTAGPGLFAELADATDGLFLGRRAHDPAALAEVLSEVVGAP
ncbi:MAG: triose-phosphate isomerase family protein [Propionibacteriaceae bacterium]